MKRTKGLLIFFMVLSATFLFCSVGCSSKANSSSVNASQNMLYANAVNASGSIDILEETLTLDLYDTFELTVTVKGVEGNVNWTSSDSNTVFVEDGKIIGKKTGSARVTASIGGKSDVCNVTVVKGDGELEFADIRDFDMVMGTSEQLDATLVYKGKVFDFCQFTYKAESGKNLITVDNSGLVTASQAIGSQEITVTAKYAGNTVATKQITVTVYEYGMIDTGLLNNSVTLFLANNFDGEFSKYSANGFTAYVNGERKDYDVTIEIVNGEDKVALSGKQITALKEGSATIKASFTTSNNKVYSEFIDVKVEKPYQYANTYFIKEGSKYNIDENVCSLKKDEIIVDAKSLPTSLRSEKVSDIKINGESKEFSKLGDLLIINDSIIGEFEFTFIANGGTYKYSFISADYVIDSAESMKVWSENSDKYMYVVVSQDFTSTGAAASKIGSVSASKAPPKGMTFNGLGNTMYNVYFYCGMFQDNRINNVTVKNLTIDGVYIFHRGVFGELNYSTLNVENVTIKNYTADNNCFDTTEGAMLGAGIHETSRLTLTNCYVEFTGSQTTMWKIVSDLSILILKNTTLISKNGKLAYNIGENGTVFDGEEGVTEDSIILTAGSTIKDSRGERKA